MIDLKTGRFVIKEGWELYPGMTREDFLKSPFYLTEVLSDYQKDETNFSYGLNPMEIGGYKMMLDIHISYHDYIDEISITKPEFYDWPDWPKDISEEDYAYGIKRYNDEFLEKQIAGNIREGNELWFDYDWGSITSSINLRDIPHVMITIRYREVPFLIAKGYDLGDPDSIFDYF
jgi:hypothetical protein